MIFLFQCYYIELPKHKDGRLFTADKVLYDKRVLVSNSKSTKYNLLKLIYIFLILYFLPMVAPQLSDNCFTGGHAKNLQ